MHSLHPGSARQAAADVGDPAARRLHLLVLAASLLWFAFWYRDTLMAMVDIWERSDTFAHGFVIAPISMSMTSTPAPPPDAAAAAAAAPPE